MELISDKIDLKLKDDLYKIANGEYDSHLTPERVQFAMELSFLFNYTFYENGYIIFNYDGNSIKLGIPDEESGFNTKNFIISTITNKDIFKNSLKSFLRDNKIKKIIG